MGSQKRQREKLNQLKEQKMKSLKFFKPTLATTLAIVLAWLLSVRAAEAGYTVTLQQVGPDVVATGSGAINLAGLTFDRSSSLSPNISSSIALGGQACNISTGLPSSSVDSYGGGLNGPTSFGTVLVHFASSGSGDMVGISAASTFLAREIGVAVPRGYVSGNPLSDSATYSGQTFATLGVTPGTYVWTWGNGANQNFTLKILSAILPATHITNVSTRA